MRQKDLHILTSSLHSYTNDWRISAVHATVRDRPRQTGGDSTQFLPSSESNISMAVNKDRSPTTNPKLASKSVNGSLSDSVWDEEEGVWSEWTLVSDEHLFNYFSPLPFPIDNYL